MRKWALFVGATALTCMLGTAASAQYAEPDVAFTATPGCGNNAPNITYNAVVTGSDATTLTLHWVDSSGTERLVQPGLPLNGTVIWPGVVLDANGQGVDWPGWSFINGTWTQTDDGFLWARTASVFATVNPTSDVVALTYPPSNPTCLTDPPGTEVLPNVITRPRTQVAGTQLPRTGSDTSVPASQAAAGLIGAGALALLLGRRVRRDHA